MRSARLHAPALGFRRSRVHGVALVWTAMLGLVLIAFLGLTLDTAWVYLVGDQLQSAADAAALAGAVHVIADWTEAQTRAYNAAYANRAARTPVQLTYTQGVNGGDIVVGIWSSNTFTPTTTNPNAVKILAHRTTGFFFGPVIGISTFNSSRTAIATINSKFAAGVIALDPSRKDSVSLTGSAALSVPEGGVQVNSSSSAAVDLTGNGAVTATELRVDGGVATSGKASVPADTVTGASPIPDPLAGVPPPSKGADLGAISISGNQSLSKGPGYYSGGIKITGNGKLTLSPGIYVLGPPGLDISSGSLNATGVMFYFTTGAGSTYGTLKLAGGSSISISPPTSGAYAGISFFQDRSSPYNAGFTLTGGSGINVSGTVYAPSVQMTLSGTSDAIIGNQLIADTFRLTGNSTITVNYDGRNLISADGVPFLVK